MNDASSTDRFRFGKNWLNFSSVITEERIQAAVHSLQNLLQIKDLTGKRVLDVGCGSGLFSLAACRLGAEVYSFDYDADAVACTRELKRRYAPKETNWHVNQGSALDQEFLKTLGLFDVIYSWGVLHHTGALWKALDNVHPLVKQEGLLAIAIYNDQGGASRRWTAVKKIYNHSPRLMQSGIVLLIGTFLETRSALIRLCKFENPLPFKTWAAKKNQRGMTVWHDLVDWVGGYPFETAKPEAIFDFYRHRSFILEKLKTCAGGHGCNEFVFRKHSELK